jgi:hypothetical protein
MAAYPRDQGQISIWGWRVCIKQSVKIGKPGLLPIPTVDLLRANPPKVMRLF